MSSKLNLSAGLLLLSLTGAALALPTDRDQPIKVSADNASFDEKTGLAVYRGRVVVRQGTLELTADEVTLTVGKDGAVQKTVAKGKPARYQQQPDEKRGLVTAEASTIEYDARNEKITLAGNAKLKQDSSSFSGANISYSIRGQQIDAKGDGNSRVELVFPPQAREQKKD